MEAIRCGCERRDCAGEEPGPQEVRDRTRWKPYDAVANAEIARAKSQGRKKCEIEQDGSHTMRLRTQRLRGRRARAARSARSNKMEAIRCGCERRDCAGEEPGPQEV